MNNVYSKKIAITGFLFISILGTVLHFVYELSGNNKVVALFSAVNESVWEHVKIGIIPGFIWMIILLFIFKKTNNFYFSNLVSFITIMLTIIIGFYGYTYILNKHILIIDILLFYLAIGLGEYMMYKIINHTKLPDIYEYISIILLVLLLLSFYIFTYFPPRIELFKDSQTNSYGIIK